jgi:hypothetical protein
MLRLVLSPTKIRLSLLYLSFIFRIALIYFARFSSHTFQSRYRVSLGRASSAKGFYGYDDLLSLSLLFSFFFIFLFFSRMVSCVISSHHAEVFHLYSRYSPFPYIPNPFY